MKSYPSIPKEIQNISAYAYIDIIIMIVSI